MKPFAVTSMALFNQDMTLRYGHQKVEFYADNNGIPISCVPNRLALNNSLRLRL